MKRLVSLLLALMPLVGSSQYIVAGTDFSDGSYRWLLINGMSETQVFQAKYVSPTESWISIRLLGLRLDSLTYAKNYPNPSNPSTGMGVLWADSLGWLRRSNMGQLPLLSSQITDGLGFTPYNATNPSSFISRTGLSGGTGISYNNTTGEIVNSAPAVAVSFNSSPGRALSTTGSNNTFTVSASRPARVTYTVNFAFALALATSNGVVDLDYSTNGGSSWIPVSSVSNAYTVAITLTGNTNMVLSGDVPANALVRINRTANTNVTVTVTKQQEVTY